MVIVRQLLPQVMATVPAAAPGPVPSLSARRIMSPEVTVEAAARVTLRPATTARLPVVMVVAAEISTSFTAVKVRLPLVVLVAAATLTLLPAWASTLPLMPETAALIFTSFTAFRVKVVGAVQETASLTLTFPEVPAVPLTLSMMTLVASRLVPSWVPVMSPPPTATV